MILHQIFIFKFLIKDIMNADDEEIYEELRDKMRLLTRNMLQNPPHLLKIIYDNNEDTDEDENEDADFPPFDSSIGFKTAGGYALEIADTFVNFKYVSADKRLHLSINGYQDSITMGNLNHKGSEITLIQTTYGRDADNFIQSIQCKGHLECNPVDFLQKEIRTQIKNGFEISNDQFSFTYNVTGNRMHYTTYTKPRANRVSWKNDTMEHCEALTEIYNTLNIGQDFSISISAVDIQNIIVFLSGIDHYFKEVGLDDVIPKMIVKLNLFLEYSPIFGRSFSQFVLPLELRMQQQQFIDLPIEII